MKEPIELSTAHCEELLRGGVVGRIGFQLPSGPRIFPVNYSVVDASIVFRTAPYSEIGTGVRDQRVAFEIDHFDHERQQGWSVLAVGPCRAIEDPDELEEVGRVWDPRPWAGGQRPLYLQVRWEQLSGRRVGEDWTYRSEQPFRRRV